MMGVLFLLLACGLGGSTDFDSGDSFNADVNDTGVDDTDGSDKIIPVAVESSFVSGCREGGDSELVEEPKTSASVGLHIGHINAYQGCCPEFMAEAELNQTTGEINVSYEFLNDSCDCDCTMDVHYILTDIPVGDYTLKALDDSLPISIGDLPNDN